MIKKTHIAIGVALALYFILHVQHKLLFIPIVIISSLLPDVDSAFSSIGRKKIFLPLQVFTTHRGALHSYTVCIILSLFFAFYLPIFALPFFLGYSFHLFADSFTINGIRPFWPLKYSTSGRVRTGGIADRTIFMTFSVIDVVLFMLLFV